MASYINPVSLEPKNDFVASGMLGGALALHGQNQADQLISQDMQSSDLDNQIKAIKAKEDAGLLDSKLAQAAYIQAKAQADTQRINSGMYGQVQNSQDQSLMSKDKTQMVTDDVNQKMAAAPLWQQMAAELKERGGKVDWKSPDDRNWYAGWHDKMAPYAPNMPSFPDEGTLQTISMNGDQATKFINTKGAGANVKNNQALALAAIPADSHVQASKYTADRFYDRATAVADTNAQAKIEQQKLRNETATRISSLTAPMAAKVMEINSGDGVKTEADKAMVDAWASEFVNKRLEADPNLKSQLGLDSLSDAGKAAGEAKYQALVQEKANAIKGYKEFVSGKPSTVTSDQPSDSSDPIKKAAISGFGKYEPDKYDYKVNSNGVAMRKAK